MSANNNNVSNNPGNFANRPTEEVKAIASMGGKAAHAAKEVLPATGTTALPFGTDAYI